MSTMISRRIDMESLCPVSVCMAISVTKFQTDPTAFTCCILRLTPGADVYDGITFEQSDITYY